MIKARQTFEQMESFVDRWTYFVHHAVIEPAVVGRDGQGEPLMPDPSPVPMTPPRRTACRQLPQRMTIHSDGRVALCDQDWLTSAAVGHVGQTPLPELWHRLLEVYQAHRRGRFDVNPLCAACHAWHRP